MKPTMTWLFPIWTIIWKAALFFFLWGILLAPFIVPFSASLPEFQRTFPLQMRLLFDLASAFSILAAAWIMTRFVDRRSFLSLGFAPRQMIRDLPLGLGLGAAWLMLSVTVCWLASWILPKPPSAFSGSVLVWAGVALFFNTLAQEVLTRSYIFQTIQSQTNATAAIIVSAVMFMAYHAGAYQGSWLPAFNVFAAGILFGVAYHLTGNLWLPIGIHFVWNFLLGPVLGLAVSGQNLLSSGREMFTVQGPALFTGGSFGLEGGLVVTFTTVIGIVVLLLSLRPQKANNGMQRTRFARR